MPTSKRPRKKSSRSSAQDELASLPNPMLLEKSWASLGVGPEDEALGQAQDLIYEAWEAADGRSRYALARKALKISPICADAWLLLAERPSLSANERRAYLERAVKAGELALGPDGFAEYTGHFWGFIETRPYMRARHCLAEDLWQSGKRESAIGHLREMLVLNPGDNQGLRYILLAWLLRMGDDAAVGQLLHDHGDEASTFICYTQALMAYRMTGDSEAARQAAVEAWDCNFHVPELLTRTSRVRSRDTGYYTLGGKDEAEYYLEEYGFAWRVTPGAIDWLAALTKSFDPRRKRDAALH